MINRISSDKRRFTRVDIKTPLRYQIRGEKQANNAVCGDICIDGMKLNNTRFVPVNATISVELKLLNKFINTMAQVVRTNYMPHSNLYNLGIKFINLEQSHKKYLSDYINMRTGKL